MDNQYNKKLIKKYFIKWKLFIEIEKKTKEQETVNNLIKQLKKRNEINKQNQLRNNKPKSPSTKYISFKNRYEAQKTVIDKLTNQLEEKEELINELKLGIIREDLIKSINNNQTDIREIFNDCSIKLKNKIQPITIIDKNTEQLILIKSGKAPKIVQRMEKRALQRQQKREIILERKRLIETERKRMIEEALENKRIQDEEEKRKSLEQIKERRRKELELAKLRQINKKIYLNKLTKAIEFHNKKLIQFSFNQFKLNRIENQRNYAKSVQFYQRKLYRKVFDNWFEFIESKYYLKNQLADANFSYKILKKYFQIWFEFRMEGIRSMQTAEDLYDFRLLSNCFIGWHRQTCIQILLEMKVMEKAKLHYNKRIVFQYFHQWRSLPAVLKLEKIKEEKKRKWREKVWAILPDYQPIIDD